MTGATRAAALSQRGPLGLLDEDAGRRGGSPGSRDRGLSGFLGPPLRRGPAPSGILTFRPVAQPREAQGAHSLRAARARLRYAPLQVSPEDPPLAPPLAAYLGFAGRARRGRRRSSWPAPGTRSPWAGSGASRPASEDAFSRSLLSALAFSFPRGGGGALGPQVGGVGFRDLQDAAHGADRPHQLLGRGRGLRHGTPRLRAAPRGGPGRG